MAKTEGITDGVNRNRRARFVFVTVAACLIVATYMGFRTDLVTKVNEIVADGLISLAMFLSISYVAGSSLDYSGVLARFGGSQRSSYATAPAYYPSYGDQPEFRGGMG